MAVSKSEIRWVLFSVILSFLLGICVRTAILNNGEQKIVLYRTFEPAVTAETNN